MKTKNEKTESTKLSPDQLWEEILEFHNQSCESLGLSLSLTKGVQNKEGSMKEIIFVRKSKQDHEIKKVR